MRKAEKQLYSNMFNACRKGHIDYLENNIDRLTLKELQTKDANNNTALYLAVANRHNEMALYLIERGARVDIRCDNGNTVLHKAIMNQDYETVIMLLDKGADYSKLNDLGQNPLFFASKRLLEKLGLGNKATGMVRI